MNDTSQLAGVAGGANEVFAEAPHTLKRPARLRVSFAQETRFEDSLEDAHAQFEASRSSSPSRPIVDVSIYVTQKRPCADVCASEGTYSATAGSEVSVFWVETSH